MTYERRLKRKASPVDPNKRMIAIHPFYIWSALRRFEVMDKLSGNPHAFRTPEEIASVLFSNWLDLDPSQQRRVLMVKMDLPLAYLRSRDIWVSEDYKLVSNPHRWERDYKPKIKKGLNRWRSQAGPFFGSLTSSFTEEECLRYSYESLDENWAYWTGRAIRVDRATRRAEKMLAEYEL